MLSLLLRRKGCMHIGSSARAAPGDVTSLLTANSGVSSLRKDADDFTEKVWPVLGHDVAVTAMASATQGKKKDAPKV
uniref:Uncharacterized protein n=1 Tax=Leersia perrieri TaxID=77586 RepID=A0A0D9WRL3_9ORYZ